jgi:hypothetical protein
MESKIGEANTLIIIPSRCEYLLVGFTYPKSSPFIRKLQLIYINCGFTNFTILSLVHLPKLMRRDSPQIRKLTCIRINSDKKVLIFFRQKLIEQWQHQL